MIACPPCSDVPTVSEGIVLPRGHWQTRLSSVRSKHGTGALEQAFAGAIVAVLFVACAPTEPDPAAVRLAALTAAAAGDAIDDLRAVDDPDAAGVRDRFRVATREALEAARDARDTAPKATVAAFDRSLEAAEYAEQLGDALAAALEARDTAEAVSVEAATALVARSRGEVGQGPAAEAIAAASASALAEVIRTGEARDRAEAAWSRHALSPGETPRPELYERFAESSRASGRAFNELQRVQRAAAAEFAAPALARAATAEETAELAAEDAMIRYYTASDAWRALLDLP